MVFAYKAEASGVDFRSGILKLEPFRGGAWRCGIVIELEPKPLGAVAVNHMG
jgi:hypothetical protein